MNKRLSPDEMLAKVRRLLATSSYLHKDGWFFPSDLIPLSSSFKYQCKKLYGLGLLEREGDANSRWGYSYRIKGGR